MSIICALSPKNLMSMLVFGISRGLGSTLAPCWERNCLEDVLILTLHWLEGLPTAVIIFQLSLCIFVFA